MPRIMLVGGWAYPSEKYDFVSWDDDIPNWMESHKIHVPNHQPDGILWWFHGLMFFFNGDFMVTRW